MLESTIEKKYELSGYNIEKTAKLMKLSFSRLLLLHPNVDITVDQWVILNIVKKYKSLSQQRLCELAFKDAPTVTRIIDLLESKGYINRNPVEDDRRRFAIDITDDGIYLHNTIQPVLDEFRLEAFEGISDEELKQLEMTMHKIFTNLSKFN
jgi:DNA-binding MarR family transcriptional regulator